MTVVAAKFKSIRLLPLVVAIVTTTATLGAQELKTFTTPDGNTVTVDGAKFKIAGSPFEQQNPIAVQEVKTDGEKTPADAV